MTLKLKSLLGIFLLFLIGYSGLWYTVAFEAEENILRKLASWQKSGSRISHGKTVVSGFPYRVMVTLDGLDLTTPDRALRVRTDALTLISHIWTPGHWLASAENIKADTGTRRLAFTSDHMQGSYRLHDGGANDGKTVIVLESGAEDGFTLRRAPFVFGDTPLDHWQLMLRMDSQSLPDDAENAADRGLYEKPYLDFNIMLKGNSSDVALTGSIAGPVINSWTPAGLVRWRDGGGLVDLTRLRLRFGETQFDGSGSLTLDERLRPLGSISAAWPGNTAPMALAETLKAYRVGRRQDLERALSDAGSYKESRDKAEPLAITLQLGTFNLNGVRLFKLESLFD